MTWAKYGTALTLNGLMLYEPTYGDIVLAPTFAAGDVALSKNGGAFANIGTLPTVTPAGGGALQLTLSAAELTCATLAVRMIDQTSPKAWADTALLIVTYGHASAYLETDLSDVATDAQLTAVHSDLGTGHSAISAAVSVVDGIVDAIKLRTDLITGGKVTSVSTVDTDSGVLTLVRGDDYSTYTARVTFTEASGEWPVSDLTDVPVTIELYDEDAPATVLLTVAGTVVTATGTTKEVAFALTTTQTTALAAATTQAGIRYRVRATVPTGHVRTLVRGPVIVLD